MTTPAEIAARRTQVAALSRDSLSLREIATRLGVSKDTVSRDLDAIRDAARQDGETHETPHATDLETAREIPGATRETPSSPAAACDATGATPAPGQSRAPRADSALIALADSARELSRDSAHVSRDAYASRPFAVALVSHAIEILTAFGPPNPVEQMSVRRLAARLSALADPESQ